VSAQQRDEDDAQVDTATARVIAARQQVQAAGNANPSPSYPPQHTDCAAAALEVQKQIAQARTDVAVTQQEVRDAQAAQTEIQANLNYGDQQPDGW